MGSLTILQRWRSSSLALCLVLLLAACDTVAMPGAPSIPASSATSAPQAPNARPQPTPLPAATLLARALHARQIGDYDAAALDLRALLDTHPAAPEARSASFYLAESFALRGRWTSAVAALRSFVAGGPADDLYARALFLRARGQEEAGAWADSVATYERYRALKTPLAPYAQLREAAQLRELGQIAQAAEAYEAVGASDIVRGERAGAYEKAIALRHQ